MWSFLTKSLRGKVIVLAIVIVSVPILVAGYMMKLSAEQSLMEEKIGKLTAITRMLDSRLGPDGYEGILRRKGALEAPPAQQIEIINLELASFTDTAAQAFPGLGVGFYNRQLDAIVTYGPSEKYSYTVGLRITPDHPGRTVMQENKFQVLSGKLVRGNIMNAMHPIERNGEVIGYIWANELTDDIQAQLTSMDRGISFSLAVGMFICMVLVLGLTEDLMRDIQIIVQGVKQLRFDLTKQIQGVQGEMGEVAETINEMAAALEQANRTQRLAALGELMAGVAHEIRNPLTGIKGFLQYFQVAGTDEERAKYLPMILREVDRMNRIIEALLYFARPCQAVVKETDLARVIHDSMTLVRPRAEQQQVVFQIHLPEGLPMVEIDEEQFKQVFLNLFINSLQAVELNGSVSINGRYLPQSDAVELTLSDSGPGVPPEIRDKIFNPFFTTKLNGTGLGLSIVQKVVVAQGGRISLADNPEGGTVFIMQIPRVRQKELI